MASVSSWVASSTTWGAAPASSASFQRGAHRHQRSPGFRPGKPDSGIGRRQVVADRSAEGQELGGHHRADRVQADVLRAGLAAAVAEEAGHGIDRAGLQLAAQHVAGAGDRSVWSWGHPNR